ncbi:MAG: S-adenosylmethionine:tRNA ribosyltransferase-isomerase [Bacteroidota bacterium]
MSKVSDIKIEDFKYDLPEDRIAKFPLEERDQSKLLIYKDGHIDSSVYRNLTAYLEPGTLLVMNNTKVVEARLLFEKTTGGIIEVFCLEPAGNQPVENGLTAKGKVRWNCMVGGIAKWKQPVLSQEIIINDHPIHLQARIAERHADIFEIEFEWHPDHICFSQILGAAGHIPLPPYLKRKAEASDKLRYQTVYASKEGSVAAPTAGLHFTDALLTDLKNGSIDMDYVSLHVGAGTFLPVKAETMAGHTMHREWICISVPFLKKLINHATQPVIAVGTTSLRTLESIYWMGIKTILNPEGDPTSVEVSQWDPYEIKSNDVAKQEALESLLRWMERRGLEELVCTTQLMIAPGYQIKMIDGLITNFHQPSSTLLLLVAACIGEDWRKVYQYALDNDYRFLSYGDGSLLWCRRW